MRVDRSGFAGAHGYESDAPMGLQLLGHRYYDPYVGRFFNPDPIGLAGGLNLYGYSYGDPVNFVDPEGLDARDARDALRSNRKAILDMARTWRLQPELLAGVVYVETYAGGWLPMWNTINTVLSMNKFIDGEPASVGIVQYTIYPDTIPGCETAAGRAEFIHHYLGDVRHQLNDAAGMLAPLKRRRYGNKNLTPHEMSIILTEYNYIPTNSSNERARPSPYGKRFLSGLSIIQDILKGR